MVPPDVFRYQPVLTGEQVRLGQLGPEVLDAYWAAVHEPEGRRLTGTHAVFTREQTERWLRTRVEQHDRADWAVTDLADGSHLGEAVFPTSTRRTAAAASASRSPDRTCSAGG